MLGIVSNASIHSGKETTRTAHNGVSTVTVSWLRTRCHTHCHMSPRDMCILKYVALFLRYTCMHLVRIFFVIV